MAFNKECLIFIIDVRHTASEESKQKSIKCIAEIIKDKVVANKNDFLSFVLLGTKDTRNDADLMNIIQYTHVQVPSWQLLMSFYKFVNSESSSQGEWLDALTVATELIKNSQGIFKFQRQRIVLFHDFDGEIKSYDEFDVITKNLMKLEIVLNVVSSDIKYIDNAENGEPQAVFASKCKDNFQLENEKYALRLVSSCSAQLYNYQEAFARISKVVCYRPWTWNNVLHIGSHICINISGFIAIKNESNIKLKLCFGDPEEKVKRCKQKYCKGKEIDPEPEELIGGFIMGRKIIAFDENVIEEKPKNPVGITFIGFAKHRDIREEYFCGDSLYHIIHQKGYSKSAKMLDALVKVLSERDMVMIAWKVYSLKYNKPKLVVLIPNKLETDRPATLSMIELAFHTQYHFYDFPRLRSKKSECTVEQIDAIDNLIDSMNLNIGKKLTDNTARDYYSKELLPFDTLPHIHEQNVMDVLERKIILNAGQDDDQFQEMLADKNFVEVYWRVPEPIEEKAKTAAKEVKNLFPLEQSVLPILKAKSLQMAKEQQELNTYESQLRPINPLQIDAIGIETPGEDFQILLRHVVLTIDDRTQRDLKFEEYSQQLQQAVSKLLFKIKPFNAEPIVLALHIYRRYCKTFNAFDEYNEWMIKLKAGVIAEKLNYFWRHYIVVEQLGLLTTGDISLEEQIKLNQFYALPEDAIKTESEDILSSVDKLLSQID